VANLHQLFVHQLDATQTWRFQQLDLRLDQQVECDLWDKQTWSGTSGIPDCRSDILYREVLRGVDRLKGMTKDIVEDVVDPSTAAELFG
jgi:hypothetical protein